MASDNPSSSRITSTYAVDIPGNYAWQRLLDIDNTTDGEYSMEHPVLTTIRISRRAAVDIVRRALREESKEFRAKTDAASCSFRFVNFASEFETGFSQHNTLLAELTMHEEEDFEKDVNQNFVERITVRPGQRLTLYQLRFDGLGCSAVFHTVASQFMNIAPGRIHCMVEVDDVPPGPIPEGRYALRTCHGTFISAKPGGEGAHVDLQVNHGSYGDWKLVHIHGSIYGLRSCHGTFLRAWPGGEGAKLDLQVNLNDWKAMPWEQFTIVPATEGRFGIRTCHGTYICASPRAKLDQQLDKHNWSTMPWEQIAFLRL